MKRQKITEMTNSLFDGAAFFTGLELSFKKASHTALRRAGRIVRDEAKRVLGTYDYGWPPLEPETIAHKATGDSPLLETGELRRSIKSTVIDNAAYVGSSNPKALWHELGTVHVPPRPFLSGACKAKAREVQHELGHKMVGSVLTMHPHFDDDYGDD